MKGYNYRKYSIIVFIVLLFLLAPQLCKIALLNRSNKEVPKPEMKKERPLLYGEFLSWDETDKLFPRYAKAKVIDFETKLQFYVQRRAGQYHADVQPLTAEDTAIMKAVYNGKWSWKRRAVIIELANGRKIAASMHGMPHGAGAVRGNNFNGHFCIHFKDSKTHGTGAINMDHQIMVWKAANRVSEQLRSLGPQDIIEVFFAAVNQGETSLAKRLIDDDSQYATQLLKNLQDIEAARINSIENQGRNSFKVNVGVVYKNSDKEYIKNMTISMKNRKKSSWKVDPRTMLTLLDKEAWFEIRQWNEEQTPHKPEIAHFRRT
ncbi:hypothetical protein ABDB91_05830 [Desulfoscipio sp. XC116]|uniref:hypothetical protein n=1 Tax=Desulfoscipio sp. XC116 TaxID=3144975 RepID=UPI00325BE346